ncbi:MAG: cation:proton antiporter [Anaerosomatales bacterium]|nr:cation:proton antiporter [Anaerosomatales bacterium]MDT8433485.1 cation:proton antiporter [Anaerosomatales bacterium]
MDALHGVELVVDVTAVFALSIVAVLICHRLKIPAVVGFLIGGVLAGPHVLGLISSAAQVEVMAELGIALLLFVIGLELSLRDLAEIRKPFLIGGTIQMAGTAAVISIGSLIMGRTWEQAVFLGFVVALSSTAVVLKLLQDRADIESPHGRMVLGTLIYQDIAVVPLMIAAPLFAAAGGAPAEGGSSLLEFIARLVMVGALVYVSYRWLVPVLMHQVARTRSRETFLLAVLVICMVIALASGAAGLSIALGAFLAGLVISDSPFSHQAVGVIMPFRDVFMSLFFVSIGMLVDLRFIAEHPLLIAELTLGILLIKPLVAGFATLVLGYPLRTAILAGLALGQIGEFSFILAEAGVTVGLVDHDLFQIVVACAVFSMVLTPALLAVAPRVAHRMSGLPLPDWLIRGRNATELTAEHDHHGHVLVIGFGITGRNVVHSVDHAGVLSTVIELNPDVVRTAREEGVDIHYGDASNPAVLEHVHAAEARAIVIAIDDPIATRRIVELARRMSPDAFIVVRTRYLRGTEDLHSLGADEVIADEVEVSVEVLSRVLARMLVPREDIERCIREIRAETRDMARPLSDHALSAGDLRVEVPELRTQTFRVTEGSPFAHRTIAELELRPRYGVTVLAVRRGDRSMPNPPGHTEIRVDDVLFVIGPEGFDPHKVT